MALAEVCGLNNIVNFNSFNENNQLQHEIESYSRNFGNNLSLAVPPYANVSKVMCEDLE